ncbi:MAG: hypothetical protein ACWGPN_16125 [Gammaproteobacteria bacterium]
MNNENKIIRRAVGRTAVAAAFFAGIAPLPAIAQGYEMNDSHFHLTNYVQQGIGVDRMLEIMGERTGRVALFGIPLQQTWSHENSGDFAPQGR